ncbi:hypothetical protein TgHK011_003248 [Trichoderma gracile]|nr:hypothetical protein TgHK011_003248 [Trichoderma gracile]
MLTSMVFVRPSIWPARACGCSLVPVLRKAATLEPVLTPDHGVTAALRATGQLMAASGQRAKGCWGPARGR